MRPFLVNVADLVHRPGAHRRERVSGRIEGLEVSATRVPTHAEVSVDTLLEWVSEGILATGTVVAPWEGECRRCLVPVGGELQVAFRELFEEPPREGESYPLRADHVDLLPLVRESVLCDLPLAPLCDEECRGLCPHCGADRNSDSCGCTGAEPDRRWAALDVLRSEPGVEDTGGPA